jgi:hypothetical protein
MGPELQTHARRLDEPQLQSVWRAAPGGSAAGGSLYRRSRLPGGHGCGRLAQGIPGSVRANLSSEGCNLRVVKAGRVRQSDGSVRVFASGFPERARVYRMSDQQFRRRPSLRLHGGPLSVRPQ